MAQSVPPADIATEQVILGAVLEDATVFERLRGTLTSGDFYDPKHRLIWATAGLLAAKQRPINTPEIAAELHASDRLADAGGSPYLATLQLEVPAVAGIEALAERIVDLSRKRRALAIIDDAAAHGRNGITDVREWVADVSRQLGDVYGVVEPKEPKVRVLSAVDIFARLPPIPWVIRGLDICPGAPSLFAGYGYSGKSMVLQAMALDIASGSRVWGSFEANQGACIHFDYEQGEHLTRLRYQRLAYASDMTPSDLGDRLQLVCHPRFYLDEPEAEGLLFGLCEGKTLAVIDSFRAACRSTDENSSEARVPLDMLGRISEKTGCAFAVIHHARKPQKDSPGGARDSIRGSGALYDACGSVFVLEGQPDDPERTIHHVKARVSGKTQESMTLRIEDAGDLGSDGRPAGLRVTVLKAPTAEEREKQANRAKHEKLRREVLQSFTDGKDVRGGADAVAKSLGRKASDVRSVLAIMVQEGELEVSGSSTTDKGYHHVGT